MTSTSSSQSATPAYVISDKVCIDILQKLICKRAGLIRCKSGRSFVTIEQIDVELRGILEQRSQITAHELCTLLDLEQADVDKAVERLVTRSAPNSWPRLVNGFVVTSAFFETVAQEVRKMLVDTAYVKPKDVMKRFSVDVDFVREIFQHLQCDVDTDGAAFTAAHVRRCEAAVQSALDALTAPTGIAEIAKVTRLTTQQLTAVAARLIKSGRVDGVLDMKEFTPRLCLKQRDEYVESFFAQNGFLDVSVLDQVGNCVFYCCIVFVFVMDDELLEEPADHQMYFPFH
jgi:hypothetical protein